MIPRQGSERPPTLIAKCATRKVNRIVSETILPGTLYVVATPIGNVDDFSPRAVAVLQGVTQIAAEDTRHSRPLLRHFGIQTPLRALHEHNEREVSEQVLSRLEEGDAIALISDAGTPLISDPGYHLVREARARGLRVVPIPGPSAAVCALSAAGIPTDRFVFEGFLPAKTTARRQRLEALGGETRTVVLYESSHRIVAALKDMMDILGEDRPAVVARELTKRFETIRDGTLGELLRWVAGDADQQKGEFVLLVQGDTAGNAGQPHEEERVLRILLEELPTRQAAVLAARITGGRRNRLYALAQNLKREV